VNKGDFLTYLTSASYHATKFAERYVRNKMVYDFKFEVRLKLSSDPHATDQDHLFNKEDEGVVICQNLHEVVDLLWRDSKVPEWIDVAVKAAAKDYTLLELRCSDRYTGERDKMVYSNRGQGPFGIKSPSLSIGFDSESGK